MMKGVPAIYCDGQIHFSFRVPNFDGPVHVMVIFPDHEEYIHEPDDYYPENPEALSILPPM